MTPQSETPLDTLYRAMADWSETRQDYAVYELRVISDALVALGETGSWSSVWWMYSALHYDLTRTAYGRALELGQEVAEPETARAAALMLTAEIEVALAHEDGREVDPARQVAVLNEALSLAPGWPNLHLRVADAYRAAGNRFDAAKHEARAVALFAGSRPPGPAVVSGWDLGSEYMVERTAENAQADSGLVPAVLRRLGRR